MRLRCASARTLSCSATASRHVSRVVCGTLKPLFGYDENHFSGGAPGGAEGAGPGGRPNIGTVDFGSISAALVGGGGGPGMTVNGGAATGGGGTTGTPASVFTSMFGGTGVGPSLILGTIAGA